MARYYGNILRHGSQGDEVKEWQEFLNTQGYNLDVDGIFGDLTTNATSEWQKKNGLSVDGKVGEESWGMAETLRSNAGTNTSTNTSTNTTATAKPTVSPLPAAPTYDTTSWNDTEAGKAALGDYNTAKDAVNNYGDFTYEDYVMGEDAQGAKDALNAHNANKPGEYQSQWQSQLDALMNSIMNRDKFSYDLNGDALYQQYKDKYIQQGKLAMGDAIGQASAMTGGYGNSYAQSVGQQQYQAQLQNLNDIVPELYQMALDKYNMEGQELYNQYGLVADRENTDYGRYRDTVNDWNNERSYLQGVYNDERSFDYGKYVDDRNLDYTLHQDGYNKLLDALGIAQSDYYNGADMFHTEQNNKNSVAGQEFSDAMNIWNANTEESWRQAEWDEALRQYENEEAWRQKDYELKDRQVSLDEQKYEDSKATSNTGDDGGNGGSDDGDDKGTGYDNQGLSDVMISAMQKVLGVTADGKWGSASSEAAGGLTAKEAWTAYQNGTLGKKQGNIQPTQTKNTTSFISNEYTRSEYNRHNPSVPFNDYIKGKIDAATNLTDEEVAYLINYYGLSD